MAAITIIITIMIDINAKSIAVPGDRDQGGEGPEPQLCSWGSEREAGEEAGCCREGGRRWVAEEGGGGGGRRQEHLAHRGQPPTSCHRGGAAGEHVGVEQQPGHHPGPAKGPRGEGREGCLH